MDTLERRYRLLLRAFPREYRERDGEALLGTLLDCAPPTRRMPPPADAGDLLLNAARQRLGTAGVTGLHQGIGLAAPIALSLAAGVCGFAWWRLEAATGTTGPIAYLAWILAALCWLHPRPRPRRAAVAVALAATTLAVPAATAFGFDDRPPLWMLATLTVLGLLTLGTSAVTPTLEARVTVPTGAVAFVLGTDALARAWPPGTWTYYEPALTRLGLAATLTALCCAAIAIAASRRDHGARDWIWATALLALPVGWLGPLPRIDIAMSPHFGRLAQVLLATSIAAIAVGWLAGERPRRPSPALGGTVALGCAVGLCVLFSFIGGASPHAKTTIGVLALAGLLCRPAGHRTRLLATAGATIAAGWLIGWYGNGWTPHGWQSGPTTALIATLALPALAVAVASAARAPSCSPSWIERARRIAIIGLGGCWLAYLTIPHLVSWAPLSLPLAGCVVAAVRHRHARPADHGGA